MEYIGAAFLLLIASSAYAAMLGGILFISGIVRSPYSAFAFTALLNAVATTLILINAGEHGRWSDLEQLPFVIKLLVSILLFGFWWILKQRQAKIEQLNAKQQVEKILKETVKK